MSDEKRAHILSTALDAFLRHGYRRVNMQEIADAAGISRQGLYLYFRTKEEVFSAAVEQRAEGLLKEIRQGIEEKKTVEDKILYAFDVWTVRDFEKEIATAEAKEIHECMHAFMNTSFEKMRLKFEAILSAVLSKHTKARKIKSAFTPEKFAHLIYSSMRGFKLSAKNGAELRKMIHDLLKISIPNMRK
jgi:TetR/AcrR family transcriptional regulator of autoinduction and epiphytic fitness